MAAANNDQKLHKLFPAIEPYESGKFKVDGTHDLYYELVGNPKGKPAVFLHGGPGGGLSKFYRQLFDPAVYRVLLFDQRGAGDSTPAACLENNTTWDLVEDIERFRKHFGVDKWLVVGGSWGSTLALAYAETHPDRVSALVLRGIFTLRHSELKFFYQDGASHIFPEYWEKYVAAIPEAERLNLMHSYHRRINGKDPVERLACAKAWTSWEMATSRLIPDPVKLAKGEEDDFAIRFASIESHFFVNGGFFKYDGQLLNEAHKLNGIPGDIVCGRYDVVCPVTSSYELHKKWEGSRLHIVPDAGHSQEEPGIISEVVAAIQRFASQP